MSSIIIKKRLLPFLLLLLSFTAAAQPSVSGTVQDASGNPVPFANILLKLGTETIKASSTAENGAFEMTNVTAGSYELEVTTIGFKEFNTTITVSADVILPAIILEEEPTELDSVVVNSKRPVVKRKIDRLEFDVENSILSSENAWEILRKTPGVNVIGDGISIRGSSGILVTINDKKVYLTGTELKNFLENTNGDDIKSIEVITTPPARYEAQGSAVLNIKMKKNIPAGYKGSVVGAYVQSMYPKGVVATNHYYKSNDFTVYGGYMFGSGHYYGENIGEIKYFNEDNAVASVWESNEQSHFRALQQNSYHLNAEFAIDSLNTIGVGANGFASLKSTANIKTPTYIYDGAGTLDSLYTTHNRRDYPQRNNTLTALFEHKFSDADKITLSSDYTQHYFNQEQDVNALFSLPGAEPHSQQEITSNDTRRINLLSIQADYTGKTGDTGFEAGARYGRVDAANIFNYTNDVDGEPVPLPDQYNKFLYDEQILALYVGAEREFGKWGFKAGLRGEHTKLEGNSVTTGQVNTQDYFKVFPSVYALYKASDNHQVGFSYGKRIIRPQYAALNPFRSYNTPYYYSTGDPKLQPAITHNFSLQYTLKAKYNFDLFYRHELDPAAEILYQEYETNTVVSKYTNISRNIASGLEFNTSLQLYNWWETSIMTTLGYQENMFQGAGGEMQVIDRWTFYGSANSRFTLNKKKDLLAEANFFYMSPTVQGALKLNDISNLSVSFRKLFWEGNGELSLIFSDIYKGERQTSFNRYANQSMRFTSYGDTQSFRIQFRYRFGNQKLQERARGNTDEQRRL